MRGVTLRADTCVSFWQFRNFIHVELGWPVRQVSLFSFTFSPLTSIRCSRWTGRGLGAGLTGFAPSSNLAGYSSCLGGGSTHVSGLMELIPFCCRHAGSWRELCFFWVLVAPLGAGELRPSAWPSLRGFYYAYPARDLGKPGVPPIWQPPVVTPAGRRYQSAQYWPPEHHLSKLQRRVTATKPTHMAATTSKTAGVSSKTRYISPPSQAAWACSLVAGRWKAEW